MNFEPIAIALRPRKLTPALPKARAIFAPSPGLSLPSILTQWIVSVFARPTSCAAFTALAPLTGDTNMIPLPGCSGVRRANTSSRAAPALASASSLSAAPPARSTSVADQTSAFVTLSAMVFSSFSSRKILKSTEEVMSGWSKVAAAVTVGFGVAMGGGLDMAAEISVLSSNGLKEVLLEAMDDAAKAGKLAAGSRVTLARTGVAVAVRAGAPKPDIGSADAFRKSLLAAKSFAHSRGASGVHMAHVIERLGISEQMKPKTVIVAHGAVGAGGAKGADEMA